MATLPSALQLTLPQGITIVHSNNGQLPLNPVTGTVCYDQGKNCMMIWTGTAWTQMTGTPPWNLFIDDIRDTHDVDLSPMWLGMDIRKAKTCEEAIFFLENYGLPERISFDHDLGPDTDHATKIMWHIINGHLDEKWDCNTMKEVMVHSVNTPGAENLLKLWRGFCDEFSIVMDTGWKPALK